MTHLETLEKQQQQTEAGDEGEGGESTKLEDLIAFSNASLEGCKWNLRLYTKPTPTLEEVEVEATGDDVEGGAEKDEINGETDVKKEEEVQEEVINSGICASWLEQTNFESGSWHSVGISIAADGDINLIVDGANRILVNSDSDLGLGTVSAWLPEPTPEIIEKTVAIVEEGESTPEVETEVATPSKVELIVKTGNSVIESDSTTTTIGFVGAVASFGLCRHWDHCNLNNVCSIFNDETTYTSSIVVAEGEEAPPAVVDEVVETVIVCRCGRGTSRTLIIPESTPPGNYYLEVSDGVTPACLSPPGSDTQTVTPGCSPVDLKNLCSWIPQLPTASNIKITVIPLE